MVPSLRCFHFNLIIRFSLLSLSELLTELNYFQYIDLYPFARKLHQHGTYPKNETTCAAERTEPVPSLEVQVVLLLPLAEAAAAVATVVATQDPSVCWSVI